MITALPGWAGHRTMEALRALRSRSLSLPWRPIPIRCLDQAGAEPRITLAGSGPGLDYLLARGLGTAADLRPAGWTMLARLGAVLQVALHDATLVLARLPTAAAGVVAGTGLLRLPELVDAVIDLPPAGERWPRTRSARSSERRVRTAGLTWRLSHEPASFRRFYRELYRPYAIARFGGRAVLRPEGALRARFRSGAVQEVCQGRGLAAAQLVTFSDDGLECVAVGAMPGQEAQVALAATTLFAGELARARGLTRVNLGGCLPALTDPVLANKRLWGATLQPRARADHDLLIGWEHPTPAVASFLARLAPIVRTARGMRALGTGQGAPGLDTSISLDEALAGASRLLVERYGHP